MGIARSDRQFTDRHTRTDRQTGRYTDKRTQTNAGRHTDEHTRASRRAHTDTETDTDTDKAIQYDVYYSL